MTARSFQKAEIYTLLTLAIPLAATGLLQSAIWFFETIFLSHIDAPTLAAGSLVSWLFGTVVVIVFGALSSINILVSHKHGANDELGISYITRDGLLLAVLISIPLFLLFWNMSPLFLLFGQPPSVVILAKAYLHALAWGILANNIGLACLELIVGIGHARIILLFSIVTVLLNIVFSWLLIFGKYGFPALGIAGAGWGMTISYWGTTLLLVLFILLKKEYRPYFKNIFTFTKPYFLLELLRIGLPIGLMYCIEVGFFFAIALVMGLFSSDLQAANQIALQYMGLIMSMMFSIAQAVTVRMGHLLGAKEQQAAKRVCGIGVSFALLISGLMALIYVFFPDLLISIDFDMHDPANHTLISYVKKFFLVSAVFQFFEATRIILFGALRGLKDTRFTLLTSFISFWCLAFPLGYLFSTYLTMGGTGMWWGMVIGASFSVALLHWRFQKKIKTYHPI
jgi:MATE family multidrug resistance protein